MNLKWPFGGDTESDIIAMKIGFELYEETYGNPAALTSMDILEALENSTELGYKESRQPHWCWHSKNNNPKKPKENE